jgi:hypothetical protein
VNDAWFMQLTSFRRKLKRAIDEIMSKPEHFQPGNWFNLWHAHVDIGSKGRESPAHRQAELRALFQLHEKIREHMNGFQRPFQQWVLVSQVRSWRG